MIGWPNALWLVRHGESVGNLANARASETGALRLDLDVNDIEVPLSDRGRDQAQALGRWIERLAPDARPTAAVVSPYLRARQTAEIALAEAGLAQLPTRVDERLRDREQGVLDRLTASGIRDRYPEEAERRAYLGKFWYRPSEGESWADVAQRVREALLEVRLTASDERVLVVTHDVPLILVRYVIEELAVEAAVALAGQVANCSVTRYDEAERGMRLAVFNDTTPLEHDDDAVVTAHE
jgi:broad specificity phosphatase PhoE